MKKLPIFFGLILILVLGGLLVEKWTRLDLFEGACTYCGARTNVGKDYTHQFTDFRIEDRMPWLKHDHRWVPDGKIKKLYLVMEHKFLESDLEGHGPQLFVLFLELKTFWEVVKSPSETPERLQAFYQKLVAVAQTHASNDSSLKELLDRLRQHSKFSGLKAVAKASDFWEIVDALEKDCLSSK